RSRWRVSRNAASAWSESSPTRFQPFTSPTITPTPYPLPLGLALTRGHCHKKNEKQHLPQPSRGKRPEHSSEVSKISCCLLGTGRKRRSSRKELASLLDATTSPEAPVWSLARCQVFPGRRAIVAVSLITERALALLTTPGRNRETFYY